MDEAFLFRFSGFFSFFSSRRFFSVAEGAFFRSSGSVWSLGGSSPHYRAPVLPRNVRSVTSDMKAGLPLPVSLDKRGTYDSFYSFGANFKDGATDGSIQSTHSFHFKAFRAPPRPDLSGGGAPFAHPSPLLSEKFLGTFKFLLIAGIFGVISYYAYNFTLIGLEKKEALV